MHEARRSPARHVVPRRTKGASRRAVLLPAAATLAAGALPLPALAQQRPQPGGRKPPASGAAARHAGDTPLGPVDTIARQALIIDYDTGAVLLEKNADERMPPSSMSKLMTIYLVFERLKQGRMKLDQELPVSERAWRMGGIEDVRPARQRRCRSRTLIRGVIVQSGNDACIVLAEAIAGREAQFAELMNQKAKETRADDSNFRNATGWPDPEQQMTAATSRRWRGASSATSPNTISYYNERRHSSDNNISQDNRNPLVPGRRRRWAEDRPHRGGRLWPGGQRQTRRPAGDRGVERPDLDARSAPRRASG